MDRYHLSLGVYLLHFFIRLKIRSSNPLFVAKIIIIFTSCFVFVTWRAKTLKDEIFF